MQKFITLFLTLVITHSYSQITITDADMPQANDTVRWSNTFDQWGIDATETGANYTWDYSFLTQTSQELDTFFSVTSTPFPYQFYFNNQFLYPAHKSSFATKGQDFDLFGIITMTNVYDFFKVDASHYGNTGFGANINSLPASVRNIPVDTIYKFPMNYSDTYTTYSEWEMAIPNTFTYGQSKVRNVEIEGWGTLITPLGTFQTLKVKMDVDIIDTLSVDSLGINFSFPRPTATEYHWLANGYRTPLLTINTSFGIITGIQYQDSLRTVGVNENELLSSTVYPNPSNDYVVVTSEGKNLPESIQLFDANGKMVVTQNGNNSFINIIRVSELPSGFYTLVVNFSNGISRNKISIIH